MSDRHSISIEKIASVIDHTILRPDALPDEIMQKVSESCQYGFKGICLPMNYVTAAKDKIVQHTSRHKPLIITVVNFPHGNLDAESLELLCHKAVQLGADEVDIVWPIGAFLARDYDLVQNYLRHGIVATNPKLVKIIVETSFLTHQQIAEATRICHEAGAAYIKTSTGFSSSGAHLEDVKLMKQEIIKLKSAMKIKASGGIRTLQNLLDFVDAGADRIGTSSGVAILQSIAG